MSTATGAWLTATLSTLAGPCGCPTGCDNCAFRSPSTFNGTTANYVTLLDTTPVFDVQLGVNTTVLVTDGVTDLTACPSLGELECLQCADGYFPAYYAGRSLVAESVRPQHLHGTGFQCITMDAEACDPLTDAACSHNFTFQNFGTTIGYLLLFFLMMLGIFQTLRAIPLFRYTCDPNFYMAPGNPRYPPNELPSALPPGHLEWIKKAWRASDTDILKHATPDELMMLRWFRTNYHFFFGASLFCTPVLMALYWIESEHASGGHGGMKRFTIEAAKHPNVFWVVILEMWLVSFWAMYLLSRETKAYARLIWKLGPTRLGIKSHAVVVNDIPMLTTAPIPNSLRKQKDDIGILSAINSALTKTGAKNKSPVLTPLDEAGDGPPVNGFNRTPSSRAVIRALQKGETRSVDGLGGLSGFQEKGDAEHHSTRALQRANGWMTRNASAVRSFMHDLESHEIDNLRACIKTEMVQNTKMKLETVLGEGCVVTCLPARDVRHLDKESENWHAANERHLQALIRESNAGDDLIEAEAEFVRSVGGLGRLPTMKFSAMDDDVGGDPFGDGDMSSDPFGERDESSVFSFPGTSGTTDDAELGGIPGIPGRDHNNSAWVEKDWTDKKEPSAQKKLEDPKVTRLRAKRDWAVREREIARNALASALKRFDTARHEYLNDETPSPSMLVVFSRQMDAVIASQVQVDRNYGAWRTVSAPGPNDLVWHNIALTSEQRNRKNIRAKLMAFVMVFFFLVPVNLLGAAITDAMAVDGTSFVSQVSVALILIIFLVAGHILSLVLSRQYGHIAVSKMDVTGASIYFWLLILNLFVSNLSSTPVWVDVIGYVRNPKLIVDELITKIIDTSSFFLQFCMLRCAQSAPLELIHPPAHIGLAVKTLVHLIRAGEMPTRKMIQNWTAPENTPLHRVPAQTMLVVFLGMMYCVVAPVFMPICGIMFSLFYLFWKHNLCYHYTQPYAAGQTLWPWLVRHTYVCLLISQVILALGLPTLVSPQFRTYESVKYMRLALCPIPIITVLEMRRTERTLQESYKVPVHKQIIDEVVAEREAEHEQRAPASAPSENVFDERGVVGDVGKYISGKFASGAGSILGSGGKGVGGGGGGGWGQYGGGGGLGSPFRDNGNGRQGVGGFLSGGRRGRKPNETQSPSARKSGDGGSDSPKHVESKSSFDGRGNGNSSNAGTARRLNLTAEEARSEVQRLIDMGVWRNYQPISIWPQVSERAAASLIIRRWREKKSVKLRLARRKADAAFGVGPPVGTPEHGSEHDVNRTGPFTAAGPATRDGHKRELSF